MLIKWLKNIIDVGESNSSQSKNSSTNKNFQKLTPLNDVKLDIYEDSLNFIFKNNELSNIAITGSFGSGKSSIIRTYEKKYPKYKFLYISLSPFENVNTTIDDFKMELSIIEKKILNTLIHTIDTRKIRLTRKIHGKKVNFWKILFYAIEVFVLALFFLFMLFNEKWKDLYNGLVNEYFSKILKLTVGSEFKIVFGLIVSIVFIHIIYKLLKIQSAGGLFEKISIQGAEFKLFQDKTNNVFDKYLDEILYLLEKSEIDVIIFEDFERFKDNRIFTRLRELNNLLNYRNQSNIKFFYLINNVLFKSKDRTKFFDYILPIVPVIDSSNSYAILKQYILNSEEYIIGKSFLKNISLFIDDMRLLKNILNEFLIYYSMKSEIEIDHEKLFSLITYKNIFPFDYNNLQFGTGYVHFILNSKKEMIQLNSQAISEKITVLREQVDIINEKKQKSEKAEDNVDKKDLIIKKKLISTLEEKLANIDELNIYQLINSENANDIFDLNYNLDRKNEYKDIITDFYFSLLKFLISQGYIDETYSDYISKFYDGGRLCIKDKNFVKSVQNKKAKKENYQIEDPKEIIEYLNIPDFDNVEVLNNDLLKYMFKNVVEYKEYLDRLIIQFRNNNNLEFIFQYLYNIDEHQNFITKLNHLWYDIYDEILISEKIDYEAKKNYLLETFYYSESNTIQKMNYKNSLSIFITTNKNIFYDENLNPDKISDGLKILNYKLKNLEEYPMFEKTMNAIYNNLQFEINIENIIYFFNIKYDIITKDEVTQRTYSFLISKPEEPLTKYINDNIEEYCLAIMEDEDIEFHEDIDALYLLLNNEAIGLTVKQKYLGYNFTIIEALSEIKEKNLWDDIIKSKKLRLTAYNLMDYFTYNSLLSDGEELNEDIIDYIEGNGENIKFDYDKFGDNYGNVERAKFLLKLIKCNSLTNERYREIVKDLKISYKTLNMKDIDEDKVEVLVDEKIIVMNEKNYNEVKLNHPDLVNKFIIINIDEYIVEIVEEELYGEEELINLITENIDDSKKERLLKDIKAVIDIDDEDISMKIKKIIIKDNFDIDNLQYLVNLYSSDDKDLKILIIDKVIEHIEDIISNRTNLNYDLLQIILESEELDLMEKTRTLNIQIKHISKSDFLSALDHIGLGELKEQPRPKVPINAENEEMLREMKKKRYITNYSKDYYDKDSYRIYTGRFGNLKPL